MFRHAFAHYARTGEQPLGDNELQRLGGWRSRQMLTRYAASAGAQRAATAGKRYAPGDRL